MALPNAKIGSVFLKKYSLYKNNDGGFMSSEVRVYNGHFASGTAVACIENPHCLPLYVLVFIATLS